MTLHQRRLSRRMAMSQFRLLRCLLLETQMYRNRNALPGAHAITTNVAIGDNVSQAMSIGHFTKFHDQASRLIEEARSNGTTLPAGMMELYDYEHKKLIERMAAIKVMMDTVK